MKTSVKPSNIFVQHSVAAFVFFPDGGMQYVMSEALNKTNDVITSYGYTHDADLVSTSKYLINRGLALSHVARYLENVNRNTESNSFNTLTMPSRTAQVNLDAIMML